MRNQVEIIIIEGTQAKVSSPEGQTIRSTATEGGRRIFSSNQSGLTPRTMYGGILSGSDKGSCSDLSALPPDCFRRASRVQTTDCMITNQPQRQSSCRAAKWCR